MTATPRPAPFGAADPLERRLRMIELGLAASEPLAHLHPGRRGWTARGDAPAGAREWGEALRRGLPERTLVRPDRKPFGLRLGVLHWDLDQLVDQGGRRTSATGLAEILLAPRVGHGWLIERRDPDDERMLDLSGGEPLGTIVAVTVLGVDGVPRLVSLAHRRPARGHEPSSEARGTLESVAPQEAEEQLPRWPEVAALLADAARATPGTAATGWDVLVTTTGPRIADAWGPWEVEHSGEGATTSLAIAAAAQRRTGRPAGWVLGHR